MLKFVIAGAVLMLGLAVAGTTAAAAPRNDDCVDCTPPSRYDSQEVVEKMRSLDRMQGPKSKRAAGPRNEDCANCPPPKKYDSQEVVKKTRNIDHSRVINTTTVKPAGRRVKETNSLVIHQNEIRNVGVIQHNHTIIEKETRYVRRVPVQTTINFVVRNYRVVERPDTVSIEAAPRRARDCGRGRPYGRYGSCGPLGVRG